MFRVLLTRRWLIALLAATLFFVACLFLGRWQFGRYVDKRTRADLITGHYQAAPVPLDSILGTDAGGLPPHEEWRRVEAVGTYDPAGRLMVRNRPQKVTYGYEVLDTLRLPGGDAILVDRGWVKNAERADVLPQVPPAPTGEVRVIGWLRPGEGHVDADPPRGQLPSIDLGRAQATTAAPLRPAYLILEEERTADGATPPRPEPLLPPTTDTGPHFAYSVQWWGASIVGFVLVFVYARREYLESLDAADPRRAAATARPRRTRIWDEEDG